MLAFRIRLMFVSEGRELLTNLSTTGGSSLAVDEGCEEEEGEASAARCDIHCGIRGVVISLD